MWAVLWVLWTEWEPGGGRLGSQGLTAWCHDRFPVEKSSPHFCSVFTHPVIFGMRGAGHRTRLFLLPLALFFPCASLWD